MSRRAATPQGDAAPARPPRPRGPGRRVEAIVVDWEDAAAGRPAPELRRLRGLLERASRLGLELVLIAATDVAEVERRLGARPAGPGGLLLLAAADGPQGKAATARWALRELWQRGVGARQVLVLGDALGAPGGPGPGGDPGAVAALLEDQLDRRHRREPPQPGQDPGWTLAVDGVDPLLARVHETLLTLADGRLGTRGSLVLPEAAEDPRTLLMGIYTGSGATTELLSAPRWNAVAIAGERPPAVRRVLDLHTGILTQEYGDGDACRLQAVLLSCLPRPGTAVLRVRATGTTLTGPRGLQPPVGPGGTQAGAADGCAWMRTTRPPGSIAAAAHEAVHRTDGATVLDRLACFAGAADGVADEQDALAALGQAREQGFERLLGEHRHAWARRWEDADVRVDGDPELQLAVRLALFHLMASVPDAGEAAVGARGLSGAAYHGHVFWDAEAFVLPFLAATHPAAARAMLEYRIRRLPAALRAAARAGRAGARFPWESAAAGTDVTPTAVRDPQGRTLLIRTGPREEHIVADVAWAAAEYEDWSGDEAFAAGPGLELLVHTARWWASRILVDADGSGHLRGVMGPDEYHDEVDDNAFTNVMARWNLRRAAAAVVARRGAAAPGEPERWLALAAALVDGHDPATGLYEQFAGFSDLEPLVIADLAPRRPVAADVLLGAARTAAAQVVKQADVLMLHYLVPDAVAPGSLAPNLAFYEPRTAHGSSLSPGVHATLLARAGQLERALELLRLTARIDLDDTGQVTAGGLHLAAMGSVWRTVVAGFGGVRPAGEALAIDPALPPGLDGIGVRLRYRGSRVQLELEPGAARLRADPPLEVRHAGAAPVRVGPHGHRFPLSPDAEGAP